MNGNNIDNLIFLAHKLYEVKRRLASHDSDRQMWTAYHQLSGEVYTIAMHEDLAKRYRDDIEALTASVYDIIGKIVADKDNTIQSLKQEIVDLEDKLAWAEKLQLEWAIEAEECKTWIEISE